MTFFSILGYSDYGHIIHVSTLDINAEQEYKLLFRPNSLLRYSIMYNFSILFPIVKCAKNCQNWLFLM